MKNQYQQIEYGGQTYRVRQPLGRSGSARQDAPSQPRRQSGGGQHTLLWALLFFVCLCGLGACLLLAAPQVLGIHLTTLPSYAFVNGQVLTWNAAAEAKVQAMRQTLDTEAIFPGITIDGVDVSGMTVQQAALALQDTEAVGGGDFAVTVQVAGKGWLIDESQVHMNRNLEEVLRQAYAVGRTNSGDLRGSGITPAEERLQTIQATAMQPLSFTTTLTYNKALVRSLTDQIAARFDIPATNAAVAGFDLNTKTFSFYDDVPGTKLDADALYSAVIDKIENDPFGRVSMEPKTVIADMTKAELMNSLRRISAYSTSTTSNANRNTNIQLSAQAINGVVVEPGATFSFNQTTGQRTAAKGYKEATAISGGQTQPEIGGGVCQTSSTLFNAVARANLEIVTRSPHAWPSSYVEKGMDATVNWPGLDFQFRNNTDWPVYIVAWYESRRVYVELYGMTLGEGITIDLESYVTKTINAPSGVKEVQNTSLPQGTRKTTVQARKGYEVETWQVWYRGGVEFDRRLLCTSTYKAYQETVEWN